MLNELFELRKSMVRAGIKTESWDKLYKQLPKYLTFKLFLGADGRARDILRLEEGQADAMRKWEPALGSSFPAFNIKQLYQADGELKVLLSAALRASERGRRHISPDDVLHWTTQSRQIWGAKENKKLADCLQVISSRLAGLLGSPPTEYAAFHELARRATLLAPSMLAEDIMRLAAKKIVENPVDARMWTESLIITPASPNTICLILELAEWEKGYDYPANHSNVISWINSRLLAFGSQPETTEIQANDAVKDAFGGLYSGGLEKFPSVVLPRIGRVILRAMNSETPAQERYGKIDAESFPAGKMTQQNLKDALEWLGDPERRGATWEDVSNACGKKKSGVLFVYPSKINNHHEQPGFANLLARGNQDAIQEDSFEIAAESLLPALSGIVKEEPTAELRIFVLAKMDTARTKVLFSRHYEVQAILDAAQAWQEGAANIPEMYWISGSSQVPNEVRPCTPFPVESVQCCNLVWLREGTEAEEAQGLSIGDGLSLLMERGVHGQAMARRALAIAMTRALPLLLTLGRNIYWGRIFTRRVSKYDRHGRIWPCLLGIFLHKLNILKGDYMHDSPFLVGRMFSLVDQLHKTYCQEVRGAIPPQLLGNSLMRTALENPAKGLARLTERLTVYQGWASTFLSMDDKKNDKVREILEGLGETSMELADKTLPSSLDAPGKAAMLLGYLARTKKQPATNEK